MIAAALKNIQNTIPEDVTLIAVTKTKPIPLLEEAYRAGIRHFGENKVQEMTEKWHELPKDIHWHLIGHLQTNKVKTIAPYVHLIHTVDSYKLLLEINKQAKLNNRIINCLLQFHIATEETKFGLNMEEADHLLEHPEFLGLENVNIVGVMGMASFVEDEDQIKHEFQNLYHIFLELKSRYFSMNSDFETISMGMSGDYLLAIEEGSTMVRVGSAIFGTR
jgi:pyridoxal phosphate enzyme (YggS family)